LKLGFELSEATVAKCAPPLTYTFKLINS